MDQIEDAAPISQDVTGCKEWPLCGLDSEMRTGLSTIVKEPLNLESQDIRDLETKPILIVKKRQNMTPSKQDMDSEPHVILDIWRNDSDTQEISKEETRPLVEKPGVIDLGSQEMFVEKLQNTDAYLDIEDTDGETNDDTETPPEIVFERIVHQIDNRSADPDSQKRLLGTDYVSPKKARTGELANPWIVSEPSDEVTPSPPMDETVHIYYRRVPVLGGGFNKVLHMYQRHNRIHMPFMFIPMIVDALVHLRSSRRFFEKIYVSEVLKIVAAYHNLDVNELEVWKKECQENPPIFTKEQNMFCPTFGQMSGYLTNYIHIRSKWNFLSFPEEQISCVINTLCKFWLVTKQDIKEMHIFVDYIETLRKFFAK